MEKISVILVLLNRNLLTSTLEKVNLDKINVVAVIMDTTLPEDSEIDEIPASFRFGDQQILLDSFAMMQTFTRNILKSAKSFLWLVSGYLKGIDDLFQVQRFLMTRGVPEKNILNFDLNPQISGTWLANLRHIEKYGADYFVTGNEYVKVGLDMNMIPYSDRRKNTPRGGVNLADFHQDLRQSYLTAKYVFKHVRPGTIKFVFIGLSPNSLHYDNTQDFLHAAKSLQYTFTFREPNDRDNLIRNLFTDDVKDIFKKATNKQADVNFDGIRAKIGNPISVKGIVDWGSAAESLTPTALEDNANILRKYIELCIENDAQPIGVLIPFLVATRKNYNTELLKALRKTIQKLGVSHGFTCVDMFELKIGYDCFFDMMHLNSKGQIFTSAMLSLRLFNRGILSAENFFSFDYEYFKRLALVAPKEEYNSLMESIFNLSVKRISGKKKIKIGFAMLEAAHWCGKDLYDFFANDKRFETTVFLSMDFHKEINDIVKKDFWDGVEQLKSHGLNVVAVDDIDAKVPEQDLIIFLTPYLQYFAKAFQIQSMTPKTLLAYIPYAYDSSQHVKSFYSQMLVLVAWKIFFSSTITFDLYKEKTIIGMPAGVYSGYPRMDIFFKEDAQFNFEWKMAQPDAKKIIWAPHHSIASTTSIVYATFQWNYQFMYEFAKSHPETSWVVKPHPWLLYTAVTDGVFPSAEAFNEYIQAWNDLPNAQVVIGGYYQDIFATSDAMIHDCGSFISEYQYVNKPMIYLTRDTQQHNQLGKEVLNVSYCVDGQDLDGISETIQRVIIEGDDYKAEARREVFDKYLNYPKANEMLASEFIYTTIVEKLKSASR